MRTLRAFFVRPANKKSSLKADLTKENIAGSRRRKSATQKGRRKCAGLRGQVTVGYSAWCRPVESISTGGSPSSVEDNRMLKAKITPLYERLSRNDELQSESSSISNQELLCRGWFLPPNTYSTAGAGASAGGAASGMFFLSSAIYKPPFCGMKKSQSADWPGGSDLPS